MTYLSKIYYTFNLLTQKYCTPWHRIILSLLLIISPVAIYFFLWLWGNYGVTYCVIYEVITRKFRASMEPFWDLKIGKCVGVSNAFIQRIPYKLCATFFDKYVWLNFLAYVIPYINIASLHYIQHAIHDPTDLKFWSYIVLSSSSLWLKHRDLSLSRLRVGLRLHLHDWGIVMYVYALCWRLFTTCTFITMQLLGIWYSLSYNMQV